MSIRVKKLIMKINKVLVANRSEIAIRVFRAAEELGIKTVSIYSKEDRFALHRFKTDESYLIGDNKGPIQAYLNADSIIKIAKESKVDAIHPGYGFLSENPDFAKICEKNNIIFIGPNKTVLQKLGNKTEAKKIAKKLKINTINSISIKSKNASSIKNAIRKIGLPLIVKANWGGGGRGMRVIHSLKDAVNKILSAQNESKKAFGNDEVFLEKYIEDAAHVEVQILADKHGSVVHLYERDCSLQRRHQKIIERAPANYLNESIKNSLYQSAIKLVKSVNYNGAGTIEFLIDKKKNKFYFIEVNPRIQVEHTVTEQVTGIDIVKAQIKIAEGKKIGSVSELPKQQNIKINGHAIQCRITTEDPRNDFLPDYGKIIAYRSASGFGIRLDAGTAAVGALVTPYYDSLLVKITSWAKNLEECQKRMDRALREFRIRGVKTNLIFLESLINNKNFVNFNYNTNFIDSNKSLYNYSSKKDRASKLISYLGNIIVNENKEVSGRPIPENFIEPSVPTSENGKNKKNYPELLKKYKPLKFIKYIKSLNEVLVTDTTMRDAHQSLLATRFRKQDITNICDYYSKDLSQLFSIECWGGATFDVSMRFLKEDPWERISDIKSKTPNILTQMLLRGSNAVGYSNYPDEVIKFFIKTASEAGVDVFRVFDALNLSSNMQVAIEEVCKNEKICEGAICFTNDFTNKGEKKYTLKYYIDLAKKLKKIGAHIIAIKDMAGLCKPNTAEILVKELKNSVGLPVHFHTHDTSGTSSASIMSAVKAGADIVDLAFDSMSGQTSQPPIGSILKALDSSKRKSSISEKAIRSASIYWGEVRKNYFAFESYEKGVGSDVYLHQMPGGQLTNLLEQARSLGIGANKWGQVSKKYAEVNKLFGDIIKVTPTSKVVGDMTLFMIANDLEISDVLNSKKELLFPESVIKFFQGDLGIPYGGFPKELKNKILKNVKKISKKELSKLKKIDFKKEKNKLKKILEKDISNEELASYLMYPKVFLDYKKFKMEYGDLSILSTPLFYYGPETDKEYNLIIDKGKSLILRYLTKSKTDKNGICSVFFELNGQPRTIDVEDKEFSNTVFKRKKATSKNDIGSPLPGQVSQILIKNNDKVIKGDRLITIEAMKMETVIFAEKSGIVSNLQVSIGDNIESKDLLLSID